MTIRQKRQLSYVTIVLTEIAVIHCAYKIEQGDYTYVLPGIINATAAMLCVLFLILTRND